MTPRYDECRDGREVHDDGGTQRVTRHVAVVGAGAAGFMAAIAAREAGARVTLLESTADGGRKILVSGGGRCNVLPSVPAPGRFVSEAPRVLVRRLLGAWPLHEQRRYFEEVLHVPLALEDESGKYFPASNRSRDVRDALAARVTALGVDRRFGVAVRAVTREDGHWRLASGGGTLLADRVIVATGGLSVPATGSTGFGLDLARAVGHTVHPTYPALTPLTADSQRHAALAGVSLDVWITATSEREQASARAGFLFTHRGYSGPAVLDVSHVAVRSLDAGRARAVVHVAWSPIGAAAWAARISRGRGLVVTMLAGELPQRLAAALAGEAGIPDDRTCAQLRREERLRLIDLLTRYTLPWTGHEGYRPAEVTGGGVALDELTRGTLESTRAPGLFFCGEVLDAFGPIGGHNFQWAWSTGRAAGVGAACA